MPESSHLFFLSPAWRNFFENPLTVQLDHRMLAYALLLLALLHAVDVVRIKRRGAAVAGAVLLAGAVCLQSMLGVMTLLYEAALPFALAHQAMALLVLAMAVVHAQRLEWRRELISSSPRGPRSCEAGSSRHDRDRTSGWRGSHSHVPWQSQRHEPRVLRAADRRLAGSPLIAWRRHRPYRLRRNLFRRSSTSCACSMAERLTSEISSPPSLPC